MHHFWRQTTWVPRWLTRGMTTKKSLLLSPRLLLCKMELTELWTTLKAVMCAPARHTARSQPLALTGSITSLSSRGRNTPIKAGFLMVPKTQTPKMPKRSVIWGEDYYFLEEKKLLWFSTKRLETLKTQNKIWRQTARETVVFGKASDPEGKKNSDWKNQSEPAGEGLPAKSLQCIPNFSGGELKGWVRWAYNFYI